jgi:hypothetical protein
MLQHVGFMEGFLRLNRYDSKSAVFMDIGELYKLAPMLSAAKQKIVP